MAMTSCMRDEVVGENKGHVIGFRTAVDTRGMEATRYTLDAFHVTALEDGTDTPYFANVPFVHTNSNSYMSNTEYYWPGNDRRLKFYAYAPSAEDMGGATVTLTHAKKSVEGFTVNNKISEQRDLIYAYNEGDQNLGLDEQVDVPLRFEHKLSMINITARTDSDYEYNCKGVRIAGVYNKGNMADLAGNEWTIADGAVKSVFEKVHDEPFVVSKHNGKWIMGELRDYDGDDVEDYAFMIPQTFTAWDPANDPTNEQGGAYLAVYLQITTTDGAVVFPSASLDTDGDGYEWAAIPLPSSEWKAGYRYSYQLDFTRGAGYVAPELNNPSSGSLVLGDAGIRVFASLNGMIASEEEMLVNPDMIGEWVATRFEEHTVRTFLEAESVEIDEWGNVRNIVVKLDENGNPVKKTDAEGNVLIYNTEDRVITDPVEIGYVIDNFQKITILDGTEMITKIPGSSIFSRTDYVVNNENYILIDIYRNTGSPEGSYDCKDYMVNPHIDEIVRATENNNGYARISVYSSNYNNWTWHDLDGDSETEPIPYLYENVQYIYYDIHYIGPDVE